MRYLLIATPALSGSLSILPRKIPAWRDARGRVRLTYDDPRYLAGRHHLDRCGTATVRKMSAVLRRFAKTAVAP
jgi:hypothetical protein